MTTPPEIMRLAAVGDLHYPPIPSETLQGLVAQASAQADVLLLCGALTDYGRPEEARLLAKALTVHTHMPLLAVLGNHDYESGPARGGAPDPLRRRDHYAGWGGV